VQIAEMHPADYARVENLRRLASIGLTIDRDRLRRSGALSDAEKDERARRERRAKREFSNHAGEDARTVPIEP